MELRQAAHELKAKEAQEQQRHDALADVLAQQAQILLQMQQNQAAMMISSQNAAMMISSPGLASANAW